MNECNLVDGDAEYENDEHKILVLFKVIGIALPDGAKIGRLGKPNLMYKRVTKMNVKSKDNRDEILKKKNILGTPWNTVSVNTRFIPNYCTR